MNGVSAIMTPFSGVYALGRRLHVAMTRSLYKGSLPVVIVGNLTTGGTGKTPLVAYFASMCRRLRISCAVVSRGYKGSRGRDPAVVHDGRRMLIGPAAAGDEPYMLARQLKRIPVVVGRNRLQAAEFAVRRLKVESLVLDDGYQQRHRFPGAFLVVAINSRRQIFSDRLLPAGSLREPVSSVFDAHVLVLTHGAPRGLKKRLQAIAPHALIIGVRHEFAGLLPLAPKSGRPRADLKGLRVMALSAIGYPEGFVRLLRDRAHARQVIPLSFPDHHVWRANEIESAIKVALRERCDAVIVTAKDAVKIQAPSDAPLPLYIAGTRMEFDGSAERLLKRKFGDYLELFSA